MSLPPDRDCPHVGRELPDNGHWTSLEPEPPNKLVMPSYIKVPQMPAPSKVEPRREIRTIGHVNNEYGRGQVDQVLADSRGGFSSKETRGTYSKQQEKIKRQARACEGW